MLKFLDYAVELFFLWLLYKLVFEFIIPIYHSARQFRKQVHEVKQHMENHFQGHAETTTAQHPSSSSLQTKEGEYIEFEELK
jgi:hypothetical protein